MKKKNNSDNIPYADLSLATGITTKENYRLRLYRKDHKIFEMQLVIPKLSYFSLSEEVKDILIRFIERIGHNPDIPAEDFYINEMLTKLNSAYLYAHMLEELRK